MWFSYTHIYRYALFYCALLYCSLQILFVWQIEGLWQHFMLICRCHFPTAFAHCMSLSQFGNFCNIPDFLIIIIIFVLVTPKQMVVIWGHHKLCPYKMADLVNKCVFWLPCQAAILRLSLSSGLLVPWDKTTLGWGQLITLQWPLSMQVKGRVSRRSL